ncbi:MAG: hypothetical protein KC519_18815 [Anaerolineae bacterium]|nr:hypothetical protein [Anaerolineae bacterium]
MSKFAVVVLADTQTEEGFGRVFNALTAVRQLSEAGNEVSLYFDGTGTRWIEVLSDDKHPAHGLYTLVSNHLVAACGACADFFGAKAGVARLGKLAENEVDYQEIVATGSQVMTF